MTQKAEDLIASLAEIFSGSTKRYTDTLAPLMPKRAHSSSASSSVRPVRVFHRATA
jgi:hypothetical protein